MFDSTVTNDTEQKFTFDTLLANIEKMQQAMQVLHYATSENVPNIKSFYQIPEPKTRAGFFVLCHPSMQHRLPELYPGCTLVTYNLTNGG